jgi:hypothetical protein
MACAVTQAPTGSPHLKRKLDSQQLSRTQRRRPSEKARLNHYLEAIDHAAGCWDPSCTFSEGRCRKTKAYLQHLRVCKFKGSCCHSKSASFTRDTLIASSRHCMVCSKIASLLQLHASKCLRERCPVCTCHRQFIYPSIMQTKPPRILMPPPPPRSPTCESCENCTVTQKKKEEIAPRQLRFSDKISQNLAPPAVVITTPDATVLCKPKAIAPSDSPASVFDFCR